MKVIQKRLRGYASLFAAGMCLTVWSAVIPMKEVAYALGASSMVVLMLLARESRLLREASLIWDNRILVVPLAVISISGGEGKRDTEEAVVSTFGILIGSRIYKWGFEGVRGSRLNAIVIDRSRIYLTFGDEAETIRVELMHGMVDEQAVIEVKQKLWRETGVESVVTGW